MASLAHYAAALEPARRATARTNGLGTRLFGAVLWVSTFALVALAAAQSV